MTEEHPVTDQIRRGASLYSFQEEYFLKTMSMEDCIAACADMGALGIETIAEQMMPGFPDLDDAFYEGWHEMMARHGTIPTAHDMFLDTRRYKDRILSTEECLESVERDVRHASRLGCDVVRIIVSTPHEVFERSAPIAEEYGVMLLVEVHAPFHFDHPWIQRHLDVIRRVDSPYLGLMPDMGMYCQKVPRVVTDRALREGAQQRFVDFITAEYQARDKLNTLPAEVYYLGGNPADVALAGSVTHMVFDDPKRLLEYMPYCHHIQAKFYEMTDEGQEFSIPYGEIIPILIEGGYSGYLSSEYEGNRHIQDAFEVDSVEQVRRQHAMFTRLLGQE